MTNALKTLAVLALLSCGIISRAQIQTVQRPQLTANAMSLQRYADIPVSLYTGTPDINIPLDTIDNFRLRLPMTLSYHCGGVKVDEHPGWTGLGWTLNVGGVITREVRDEMDEYQQPDTKILKRDIGFFSFHDVLDDSLAWTPEGFANRNNYINNTYMPAADTEPDKFCFSFGEYTGFFFMDTDGSWKIYSERPVKVKDVSYSMTPQPGTIPLARNMRIINSITLTADDGTDYVFGEEATDMAIDIRNQKRACWCPTAWHIKRIVHMDGSRIDYQYQRGPYTASLGYAYSYGSIKIGEQNYGTNSSWPYYGQLLSPVYLHKISGDTFTADFFRSAVADKGLATSRKDKDGICRRRSSHTANH